MYELSSGYLRDNFGMRVYVFYFVPSDVCLGFLCHTISPRIKANSPVATATLRSPYYSYAHIILLKIRLRLLYNHTHLLTYEQAPSERECDYIIDDIYLFQQNMLACLRMCIFFCTFAAKINNHGKNGTRMDDRDSSER